MKPLMRLSLVLVIVFFIAGCGEDETEVQFADPNLEKEIRVAMKCGLFPECYEQHAGPISSSDLEDLMALAAPFGHISDLGGIEYCTGLQALGLEHNQVSDISPLSGLTNLQKLSLGANQISDISPLSNLTKLQELGLGGNQISDISPLSSLINLRWLRLGDNQISDISPLVSNSGIGEKAFVDLRGNPLNDEAYNIHIPALQERGVDVSY